MKTVSRCLVQHAHALAREIGARAVLIYADSLAGDEQLQELVRAIDFPTILMSRSQQEPFAMDSTDCTWVSVPNVRMTRAGQIKVALLIALAKGVLESHDSVVCLTGVDGSDVIDTLVVLDLAAEQELFAQFDMMLPETDVNPEVFERMLTIATQLAVEGREGRPVGTIFVLGDSTNVLAQSRSLVLNPFRGHAESERNILDPAVEETIKEFAAIDGAFVIRGDGVVLTAGTQLLATSLSSSLPKGLGTRHAAAAAITASTEAIAIAVSSSTGVVSVFKSGRMVTDIHRAATSGRMLV